MLTYRQHHTLTEATNDVDTFVAGFFSRHPSLRQYARVRVLAATGGTAEARQANNQVWIYPKFWTHALDVQDFTFAHELGHWVLEQAGVSVLIREAGALGIDVWDTKTLPYGTINMHEAFADCFASLHLSPRELYSRYPTWAMLVTKLC